MRIKLPYSLKYMLRSDYSINNGQFQVKASSPEGLSSSRFASTNTETYFLDAEVDGLKRTQTQLFHVAFHDYLTMLYNRQFFMDRLISTFEKAAQNAALKFAILLIALDRFKAVNDTLGHRAGDLLLIEVARRLSACTRPADVLTRIGRDEFALLVEGAEEIASMEALAQRLIKELRHKPYGLSGQEVIPSCSVGVVEATKYHRMPEDILHDADLAMYDAKRRNVGYSIFVHSMHNEALKKMQMRRDLEKAVRLREFFLEYQPIYRSATAELVGLEALIRWQHPRQRIMFPDAFIKAAEEFGFIRQIGSWALHEACTQLGLWKAQFSEPCLRVSVNVSGEQLKAVGFAAEVEQALLSSGLSPQALQLEVTESVLVESTAATKQMLDDIRSLGVAIALDDFGTGYSSLSYLDRYQIDIIKIDKSFIAGIPTRPKTVTIVKAIIDLGTALGLEVVAEGVETEIQLQALSSMSCEYVQGFLLSPPLSPSQVMRMLKTGSGVVKAQRPPPPMGLADPD